MSGVGVVNLPSYIKNGNFDQQEVYFELQQLILKQWFNSNGFAQPTLTNAQVSVLLTLTPKPIAGTHWFNSDVDAMQFIGKTGAVQTVTSTY